MHCGLYVDLDPFTDYSVRVAASNQEREAGEFSSELASRTSEGGTCRDTVINVPTVKRSYAS